MGKELKRKGKEVKEEEEEDILHAEDDLMLWLELWGEREEDERVSEEEDC